jgi:hypothetical protein
MNYLRCFLWNANLMVLFVYLYKTQSFSPLWILLMFVLFRTLTTEKAKL